MNHNIFGNQWQNKDISANHPNKTRINRKKNITTKSKQNRIANRSPPRPRLQGSPPLRCKRTRLQDTPPSCRGSRPCNLFGGRKRDGGCKVMRVTKETFAESMSLRDNYISICSPVLCCVPLRLQWEQCCIYLYLLNRSTRRNQTAKVETACVPFINFKLALGNKSQIFIYKHISSWMLASTKPCGNNTQPSINSFHKSLKNSHTNSLFISYSSSTSTQLHYSLRTSTQIHLFINYSSTPSKTAWLTASFFVFSARAPPSPVAPNAGGKALARMAQEAVEASLCGSARFAGFMFRDRLIDR